MSDCTKRRTTFCEFFIMYLILRAKKNGKVLHHSETTNNQNYFNMKNNYFYFLSTLLILGSCTAPEEDWQTETEVATTAKSAFSVQTPIWEVESVITDAFIKDYGKQRDTLSLPSFIRKLQIVAENEQAFIDLKPATGYDVITVPELEEILNNYTLLYTNLPVSATEKNYTDQLLRVNTDTAFYALLGDIASNTNLSTDSKDYLTYLVYAVYDNGDKDDDNPPPIDDSLWKKQKICAITAGWTQNQAQAVFNATLINLLY